MTRFYQVIISDPATGEVLVANNNGKPGFSRMSGSGGLFLATYTSLNFGKSVFDIGGSNPAAQRLHMDLPITFMHSTGNAYGHLQIDGIGIAELSQASNLQGLNIVVNGGMARGLPLANPQQAGLLVSGQVIQSYGVWSGSEMQLHVYIATLGSSASVNQVTAQPATASTVPLPATVDTPANLTFQWKPGQPLMTALVPALQQAFPTYNVVGAVHPGLVWSGSTSTGYFQTLKQLAQYLNQKSLSMISGYAPAIAVKSPPQYPGVCLSVRGQTISVQDGTTQTTAKQIQFIDLIGQPTWSQPYTVQCTTVMRGDIRVGDYVTLPLSAGTSAYGLNTPGSSSQYFNAASGNNGYSNSKSASIFSGTFLVLAARHVGDSREPSGNSWVTTLDLILMSSPSQSSSVSYISTLPQLYRATPFKISSSGS